MMDTIQMKIEWMVWLMILQAIKKWSLSKVLPRSPILLNWMVADAMDLNSLQYSLVTTALPY
jgi:hypothetical protein